MDAAAYLHVLKIITGTLGFLGNGIVCVVIAKVPAMRTHAIIFNQAVIDFLASVFMICMSQPIPTTTKQRCAGDHSMSHVGFGFDSLDFFRRVHFQFGSAYFREIRRHHVPIQVCDSFWQETGHNYAGLCLGPCHWI